MSKRAATATDTTVRLSGPEGLAVAVPPLLGFRPERSLVLVCLRAPRGRVGPVARVDLFPPDARDVIDQLVGCAVHHADAVAVLCYHDGDRPACIDALVTALNRAGVPLTEALSISGGRVRDAATDGTFRSDPGVPLPMEDHRQSQELAAAMAVAGRQVLPSRGALRSSIAPPRGPRLADARQAVERWSAPTDRAPQHPTGREPTPAGRANAAYDTTMREYSRTGRVTRDAAAELIALARDIAARDLLIARSVGGGDRDVVAMLIAVATWCPEEESAGVCSVLAVAAYRYGDGALAACAVDRVLQVEPHHRLAHLVLAIMGACLPPDDLAAMADIAGGLLAGRGDGADDEGDDDEGHDEGDDDEGDGWRRPGHERR